MNELEITITHMDFRRIGDAMIRQINDAVVESANAILGDAQLAIQNPPKTGKTYKHGKVTHQASAPGEAPATDTGNLVNSGFLWRNGDADYNVGFAAEYAAPLEFGTPRMEARPFLRPAVKRERPRMRKAIRDAMRSVR